jgi:dihydroxyacid dehydratase/phosphogluconate dehydratase
MKGRALKDVPTYGRSGFLAFSGNLFKRALIKVNEKDSRALAALDGRTFLVLVYHSDEELIQDLLKQGIIKNKMKKLCKTQGLSSVAVFLLNQGWKARGMPEMYYASEYMNNDGFLRNNSILLTDGRFSGATYGCCFGYMEPEFSDSKPLQRLRSGDRVQLDLKKKRIDLIRKK